MASTRQSPASHSDSEPDVALPARVRRKAATGTGGQPGTIRIAAVEGEEVHESEGAGALAGLPELLAEPDAAVWVDLVGTDGGPGRSGSAAPSGSTRSSSRTSSRAISGPRSRRPTASSISSCSTSTTSETVVASELDIVLGPGFLLTVHDGLGSARRASPGRGSRAGPQARAGPSAVGARRRPDRRLLSVCRPHRRRHRRRPGPGGPQGDPGHRRAALQAQARADPGPPCDQPGPRGLQPAHQP